MNTNTKPISDSRLKTLIKAFGFYVPPDHPFETFYHKECYCLDGDVCGGHELGDLEELFEWINDGNIVRL